MLRTCRCLLFKVVKIKVIYFQGLQVNLFTDRVNDDVLYWGSNF